MTRRGYRWLWLLVVLAVLATGIIFIRHAAREANRANDERYYQLGKEQIEHQLGQLRDGKSKSIYIYESRKTDLLVKQIEGLAEVEELTFELTDVTENGLRSIKTLPNLRKLVLYGGRPGITNKGLGELKGLPKLETLELINTHVTNDGLPLLQDLPQLRELKLYVEAFRGIGFTDAGLTHLKQLTKLERLRLDGGWASEAAVAQLQAALPKCKITIDRPKGK